MSCGGVSLASPLVSVRWSLLLACALHLHKAVLALTHGNACLRALLGLCVLPALATDSLPFASSLCFARSVKLSSIVQFIIGFTTHFLLCAEGALLRFLFLRSIPYWLWLGLRLRPSRLS